VTRRAVPLILAAAFVAAAQQPAAPKLVPLTLDGYNKLIAAHKGRVVLATFWATYCIPCRAEIPELVKIAGQLHARGLDLVVVSADEPDMEPQARKFIAPKVPASAGPLYIKSADDDDKYAAGIHARWQGELPANFVYDRTGRKVGAFMGEVPTKNIQDVIEKFL
jgi:thiol-disulfide isomerase/thioredoxin